MTMPCPTCDTKTRVYTTKILQGVITRYYRCAEGHTHGTREIVFVINGAEVGTTPVVQPRALTAPTAPSQPAVTTNIVELKGEAAALVLGMCYQNWMDEYTQAELARMRADPDRDAEAQYAQEKE